MGNTIKAIRRGIKAGVEAAQNSSPPQFEAGGKSILCSHCGNTHFYLVGVAGISIAGYGGLNAPSALRSTTSGRSPTSSGSWSFNF